MKHRTSVYHLFKPRSEAHAIALSRAGYADGADGICFELNALPPEFRTVGCFRRMIEATPVPKIFCDYRTDVVYGADDEGRMACLLKAAEAGADYIDVMGDLYDAQPDQHLTERPEALARQREAIEKIHTFGAKALISSHVLEKPMTADEMVAHLTREAEHGADVCKLVTKLLTADDYTESVRAMDRLNRTFDRPWILLGGGAFGRLQRFTGPAFGCAVEFGVHDYDPLETYDQPTIRSFREALGAMNIRY